MVRNQQMRCVEGSFLFVCFLEIMNMLINNTFLMGSYSNEMFPEPLSNEEEDECIKKMKQKGLSIRQISRLTGISFAIVRNI